MLNVALAYNLKKKAGDKFLPEDYYSEFDSQKSVDAIARALTQNGCVVTPVEADEGLLDFFKENNDFDIVFNIAEGIRGTSREAQVPAVLDFLGIPYTGSGILTLALSLHKAMSKAIFKFNGLPTPNFQLFKSPDEIIDGTLKYPIIVKPNREGSSKGLTASSVVYTEKRLREELDRVITLYEQEALAEEFIEGKEITVGVLGSDEQQALPALEIDFSSCGKSGEFFYSWRMKEYQGDEGKYLTPAFHCPARVNGAEAERIAQAACGAHKALGCLDFSRVDMRLSEDGIPYILEVNPLPGIDPDESNLTYIAKSCGIGYNELINIILTNALKRYERRERRPKIERRELEKRRALEGR